MSKVDGWDMHWQYTPMTTHPTWLIANWKMHGTRAQAADYAFRVNRALAAAPASLQAVFCPPAILLGAAHLGLPPNARLALGGQDCHAAREGAHTGSTSAAMLRDSGARYVILGHSERRAQCHETCADVLAKAHAAQAAGLVPVLCVGETAAEYAVGQTQAVLEKQAAGFAALAVGSYLLAYEPVWAIGTGKTPTLGEISQAHHYLKSTLGSTVPVLYGGSVKPNNLREILNADGVSGALIGGASLDSASMVAMMETAANAAKE